MAISETITHTSTSGIRCPTNDINLLGNNPECDSGAANMVKAVIPSTTQDMDSEIDAHCGDVIFPLTCDNYILNCRAVAWPS